MPAGPRLADRRCGKDIMSFIKNFKKLGFLNKTVDNYVGIVYKGHKFMTFILIREFDKLSKKPLK